MGWLKCSVIECVRKPIKSICLFLILSVIFMGTLIGVQVYHSSGRAQSKALEQIGAYILLELKDELKDKTQNITDDMKEGVMSVEHVKGVNQSIIEYAIPVNFENSKEHGGMIPDSDKSLYEHYIDLTPDSVILDSNWDCTLIDDFRLGYSKLIEGEYVSVEKPGVMIEEHLAEVNNLRIGSEISLSSEKGIIVESVVRGIYRTKAHFEITSSNNIGEAVFAMSPYNKIYTSLDVGLDIYDRSAEELSLYIYIDEPWNVQGVGEKIKELDFDWELYGLFNMTDTMYQMECGQIEVMGNYAKMIMLYVIAIGAVFLSLVLSLYMKYYCYDAGIFLALGARKRRVVLQYFVSMLMITILAVLVSSVCAYFVSGRVVEYLIEETEITRQVTSLYMNGLEFSYDVQVQTLGIKQYFLFLMITMIFVIFSCVPLLVQMIRFQPRQILETERS